MKKYYVIPNKTKVSLKKVGVVVEFKKDGKTYGFFDFVSDMNRLEQTIGFCLQKTGDTKREHIRFLHQEIIRLSLSKELNIPQVSEDSFQLMCTFILNYLCCLDFTTKAYKENLNQGIGILVCVDVEDEFSPGLIAVDFNFYERFIKRIFP